MRVFLDICDVFKSCRGEGGELRVTECLQIYTSVVSNERALKGNIDDLIESVLRFV